MVGLVSRVTGEICHKTRAARGAKNNNNSSTGAANGEAEVAGQASERQRGRRAAERAAAAAGQRAGVQYADAAFSRPAEQRADAAWRTIRGAGDAAGGDDLR